MGVDTQDKSSDWDEGNCVKVKRTSPLNGAQEEATTYIKSILSNGTEIFPTQANRNKRKSTRESKLSCGKPLRMSDQENEWHGVSEN